MQCGSFISGLSNRMSLASILKRFSKTFWDKAGDTVTSQGSEVHKCVERWQGQDSSTLLLKKRAKSWETVCSATRKTAFTSTMYIYQHEKYERCTKLQKKTNSETVTSLMSTLAYKHRHLHNNGLAILSNFTHTNEWQFVLYEVNSHCMPFA